MTDNGAPGGDLRHVLFGKRVLQQDAPVVMGILNVTPDSFFDGGRLFVGGRPSLSAVLRRAELMVAQGAAIVDVGGESTRPGAAQVALAQELDRVVPVIEAITARLEVIVSVDTSRAEVIRAAAGAGAGLINDVRALRMPGALQAAAETALPVCLMHMQGAPGDMQRAPAYGDVLPEVMEFLRQRIACCGQAGISRRQIIVDPGIGFGKKLEHNLALFSKLDVLADMGYPVLVGASRKSMIGELTGRGVEERLAGSLALATVAAVQGVAIVRAHDVAQTRDVLKIGSAIKKSNA